MLSVGVQTEKHSNMPPISAPRIDFWSILGLFGMSCYAPEGAGGALDVHLGLSVSRLAPQCPPDRLWDYFGSQLDITLKARIEENSADLSERRAC